MAKFDHVRIIIQHLAYSMKLVLLDTVSQEVLDDTEGAGATEARLAHHDAGRGRAQVVPLAAQGGVSQESDGRLKSHLVRKKQRRV